LRPQIDRHARPSPVLQDCEHGAGFDCTCLSLLTTGRARALTSFMIHPNDA
jgi:hypothetical protein